MTLKLLCLAGDGIGPEIIQATKAVIKSVSVSCKLDVEINDLEIGFSALKKYGSTIPDEVIDAAKKADGVILGPISHNEYPPKNEGGLNPSGVLRNVLDLHANIRPALSYDGVPTPTGKAVDLVIVRENLEGFYADRNMFYGAGEFMPVEGTALALRRITAKASNKIAMSAFELADKRLEKKVTAIHKANVMRLSDGLFLDEVRKVAALYPHIEYDEVLVDAGAALLVRDASRFDVMVTTNMFGDILSDLASELAGGLGLAASLNVGTKHALAQAQHGSAPDIAGKGLANPVSLIGSTAMLLFHLGQTDAANMISKSLKIALSSEKTRTKDLNGKLGTKAFTQAFCKIIEGKNA